MMTYSKEISHQNQEMLREAKALFSTNGFDSSLSRPDPLTAKYNQYVRNGRAAPTANDFDVFLRDGLDVLRWRDRSVSNRFELDNLYQNAR